MTHLDGRTIPLSRKGTTQPNEVEVIEGEGVSFLYFTHTLHVYFYPFLVFLALLLPSEMDQSGTGGAAGLWFQIELTR
jgi:hypothetical protein